jgi:hypothetical protein
LSRILLSRGHSRSSKTGPRLSFSIKYAILKRLNSNVLTQFFVHCPIFEDHLAVDFGSVYFENGLSRPENRLPKLVVLLEYVLERGILV